MNPDRPGWADWVPVCAAAVAALVLRAWFFLAWDEAHFDSDQAIVGLMAKHITEGRAWPLFFYGQEYMLAVEAWVMAPVFLLLGPSVFALHLTMVTLNLAAGLLLCYLLVRDGRLSPGLAFVATLPFWVAPVILSGHLIEAQGGNPEQFLWVPLLWLVRRRALLLGPLAALAFLHREFTIFAVPALLVVSLLERQGGAVDETRIAHATTPAALARHWLVALGTGVLVFMTIQALKPLADIMGPGSAGIPVPDRPQDNIAQLFARMELDSGALPHRFVALVTQLFPLLLGIDTRSPAFFAMASDVRVGWPELAPVVALATLTLVPWLAWRGRSTSSLAGAWMFPAFLMVVGAETAVTYAVTREPSPYILRYGLLVLLLPIGLGALMLQTWRPAPLRLGAALVLALLAGAAAVDHARVIDGSYRRPFPPRFRDAAARLQERGIRIGRAGYWRAYAISFLTGEQVKLTSTEVLRIQEYEDLADAAEPHVLVLQERPCPAGTPEDRVGLWFLCGP